jgi:hypothetical protein
MHEMVHAVTHRVGVSLVIVPLELNSIDLLPPAGLDDELAEDGDTVGNVEDMAVLFYVPLDPLVVRDLRFVVLYSQVAHHREEVFQEGETVIEVGALGCAKCELGEDLVAVRVEDPQVVEDALEIGVARITTVELHLVVVGEIRCAYHHLIRQVQAHEGTQDSPVPNNISQFVKTTHALHALLPPQHNHKGLGRAVLDDSDFVVPAETAGVLDERDVEVLFELGLGEVQQFFGGFLQEIDCRPA